MLTRIPGRYTGMDKNVICLVRLNPTSSIHLNDLHLMSRDTESDEAIDQSADLTLEKEKSE
jgi:hypothetical protein